jgi:riboflavin biosynthesis pyrimidine reductase
MSILSHAPPANFHQSGHLGGRENFIHPAPAVRLDVTRGSLPALGIAGTLAVPGKSIQPLRCIVSRTGEMDPGHPVFSKPGGDIHLLVTGKFKGLEIPGVSIHRQTLAEFLETLAGALHVKQLHCEGGGQLIRALAELDAIDEFHVTLAGHTIFGGLAASTATGIPAEFLPKSLDFQIRHFEARPELGECFLSYERRGRDTR